MKKGKKLVVFHEPGGQVLNAGLKLMQKTPTGVFCIYCQAALSDNFSTDGRLIQVFTVHFSWIIVSE